MTRGVYRVLFLLLVLMFAGQIYSQRGSNYLTGKVVRSEDSTAISNVTIRINGFKGAFSTDEKGEFVIQVPVSARYDITVASIGYKLNSLTIYSSKTTGLVITLDPEQQVIQEVIVSTGYQSLPKERVTGSFELVDRELFNRQVSPDVISRLDGVMPSVLFDKRTGETDNMIVRGVSTLGGSTTSGPLIVVDNFPFEGDLESLNPNDVESVTLLKDAAASSIWGASAGNGVLVITTKKGRFNERWNLSATANTTWTEKPNLFYQPRMSSRDFIEVERFLFEKGAFDAALNNQINRPVVTPVVELLDRNRRGLLGNDELELYLRELAEKDVRNDLSDHFYRVGINQQYALSLSGGTEKMNTIFSVGYDNNRSNAVGDGSSRVTLNLQNSYKPTKNLETNFGIRYAMLKGTNNQQTTVQIALGREVYPYADLVSDQGEALVVERDYRSSFLTEVEQTGQLLDWRYRPYQELLASDNQSNLANILLTGKVAYNFPFNIKGELNYQYEYQPSSTTELYGMDTYFTRNLINRFSMVNNGVTTRALPLGGILNRRTNQLHAHGLRGQLHYQKSWRKHEVSGIAGIEVRNRSDLFYSDRLYGYDDQLLTSSAVNYIERLPIYASLSSATTIPYVNQAAGSLRRFVSFYGNGSYIYDERYTISGSFRRDASNIFGAQTNAKWTPLWSVGASWNVAKETFFHSDLINALKLRATYGYSGNVRNDLAAITTLEYLTQSRLGRFPQAYVKNPPNPLLRWERVNTVNLGLDFRLRDNNLWGSLEYYKKRSTDLISPVDADPTTGFSSLTRNSAIVDNVGMDISLSSARNIGDFRWEGNLTLSVNRNTVVEYLREVSRLSAWVSTGSSVQPIEGQPAYPLVSYRWAGLDPENGNPRGFLNGAVSTDYAAIYQQATEGDFVFHGSAIPEYFGAMRNTFSYRGISVSANIVFRAKYYFRKESVNYAQLLSSSTIVGHRDYLDRWQESGDELHTNVPSAVYPTNTRREEFYRNSQINAHRGDHLRLQDINASYLLKRRSSSFQNIKFTFYIRNLGVLWRSSDYLPDPDNRMMPLPKMWSLGLNANF